MRISSRLFILRKSAYLPVQKKTKRQIHSSGKDNGNLNHEKRSTLYVHWPYCAKMCPYCNFNKYIRENIDDTRMRKCLVKETETLIKMSGIVEIKSVYFGGGTPSLAEPGTISAILQSIRSNVSMSTDAEITLEANPTSTEMAKLTEFKVVGVNRVSVGVQSLCDEDLKFLGRQHSADDAIRCVSDVKTLFPGKVSIDIMFGRPNQTVKQWEKELQQILTLCDNHISLYQLTVERGTPLFKWVKEGSIVLPDDDVMADLYQTAIETLEKRGFIQYEVSNFAKDGKEGQHNKAYWEGGQYIGVGPGAHGRFTPLSLGKHQREARVQTSDPNSWMVEVEKQGHGTRLVKQQSQLEQLEELLIMGLRTKNGILNETWNRKCQSHTMEDIFYNQYHVKQHIEAGLIQFDNSGMKFTQRGLAVHNSIIPDLLNILSDKWSGG